MMPEGIIYSVLVFVAASGVIAVAGTRMTRLADEIAEVSGIGEAVIGAVLLGACTSLSGSVMSMSAAWDNHPDLAISNAVGGIAVQTLFLAIADMSFRKSNLEHIAASQGNLAQSTLLMGLLALPMLAGFMPEITVWHIHPMTLFLPLAYGFGIYQISLMRASPMWKPHLTDDTQEEEDTGGSESGSLPWLLAEFGVLVVLVGVAGYQLAQTAPGIATHFGMSQTLFGTLFTAVSTSLPELITVLAAVRRGAYILAVGDIIGGNTFDVLFLAFSDVTYRTGSIYHAMTSQQLFIMALTILMVSVLLLGLIRRERHGIGGIGFESLGLMLVYAAGMTAVFTSG